MTAQNPSQMLRSAWKIIPHFQCSDISRSIDFYKNKLGLQCEPDEDVPTMASFHAGKHADANFYVFQTPAAEITPSRAMIALGTDEVDAYHAYILQQGQIEISMQLDNMPWGFRQFEIKDPDGNRLQFFRILEGGRHGE